MNGGIGIVNRNTGFREQRCGGRFSHPDRAGQSENYHSNIAIGRYVRIFQFSHHHPPPGLAFGEPDDRLPRMIQYSEAPMIDYGGAAYWMPAFAGMTAV